MILNREPVAIAGAIRAVVLAVMAFGVKVSVAQLGATMLAVEAVLSLLTRAQVTPTAGEGDDRGQSVLWTVVGVLLAIVLVIWIVNALDTGPVR